MNIDPNLIAVSKDGKYVYPVDSITGHKTFAPIDYFKNLVSTKYGGSVERFVKEYVTRETKKYLQLNYTPEQIKEIASKNKNHRLPKIATKIKRDPRLPKRERKPNILKQASTSETTITNGDGKTEVIRVYPWSNNPDYFKGNDSPFDIVEASKVACHRPDMYLDADCWECPLYTQCQCELKHQRK